MGKTEMVAIILDNMHEWGNVVSQEKRKKMAQDLMKSGKDTLENLLYVSRAWKEVQSRVIRAVGLPNETGI